MKIIVEKQKIEKIRIFVKRLCFSLSALVMSVGCIHSVIECIALEKNFSNSAPGWVAFVLYLPIYGGISLIILCIGLCFRNKKK